MRLFTLSVLILFSVQTVRGQQVSNVHFNESGKQVLVTYDLAGSASSDYTISLFYSINEGSWQGPVRSATGNVGTGQKTGNGKQITWEVLNDLDKLTGEIRIKVQAEVVSIGRSGVTSGTFTDSRDGHVYKQVTIGNQTWMAENLAYLPAVSPPSGGSDTKPYYYVYGYEGANISAAKATANYGTYGVLYNWPAAQTACPPGWHLPTDEEWKILEKNQGMSQTDADANGWRNSGTVGGKMKVPGTSHWNSPNTGASNSSGFTALPGGGRYSNWGFTYLGYYADFWSSSENDATNAWSRNLYYDLDGVERYYDSRMDGFSARCLQN